MNSFRKDFGKSLLKDKAGSGGGYDPYGGHSSNYNTHSYPSYDNTQYGYQAPPCSNCPNANQPPYGSQYGQQYGQPYGYQPQPTYGSYPQYGGQPPYGVQSAIPQYTYNQHHPMSNSYGPNPNNGNYYGGNAGPNLHGPMAILKVFDKDGDGKITENGKLDC